MLSAPIQVTDERLLVHFDTFDLPRYDLFLRCKSLPESEVIYDHERDAYTVTAPARFAERIGADFVRSQRAWLDMPGWMFDYQRYFTPVALDAKRYALWWDTGLGKTGMGLEFARQVAHRTGGRVVICTLLNLIPQWLDESAKFYLGELPLKVLRTRAELRAFCAGPADGAIGITNPEKFIPPKGEDQKISEVNRLAGFVLDESSLLKSGGGVIKWAIIHSCKGIEYKLSMTATPAPNDTMEYASQASFLEKLRNEGEILWTYFYADKKTGEWKIREHAKAAFYRFMASWSVYLRSPVAYGFADNLKDLPKPDIRVHEIPATPAQIEFSRQIPEASGQMRVFGADRLSAVDRGRLNQVAKGFIYDHSEGHKRAVQIDSQKPDFVHGLVRQDMAEGRQVLVWTLFDEESDRLAHLLRDVPGVVLTGKVPQKKRADLIERFRGGDAPYLITRASMLGHGGNFQNCTSMVFSGFDDSFERLYQAVRRAVRYGQTKSVRVHIPYIREMEGMIWDNLQDKEQAWNRDVGAMELEYVKAMRGAMQ